MDSLRNIAYNTVHVSSFLEEVYQIVTGIIFCWYRSEPLSAKEVNVLSHRTTSHLLVRRAALDPADGERSGKRKKLGRPTLCQGL